MAGCTPLQTGHNFLGGMLSHIDCQAQAIGSYGYGALADPGSSAAMALTGLLAIFIAIFGIRLLLGEAPHARDLIGEGLKVGIVLALATSWPAWRILGYDVVMRGPFEIAGEIGGASGLPGTRGDLATRLQAADDSVVTLTMYGTGRLTGGVVGGSDIGDSFRGIALADQTGLGWGRIAFLAGTIGPLALVRLGSGILLALAPLMAGLLLFAGTRDLFTGWLRALAAAALGSLALALVYGAELAVLEPWLADAMAQRASGYYTPSVPTELTVIGAAFALVAFAMLALIGRVAFFASMTLPQWPRMPASAASPSLHAAAPPRFAAHGEPPTQAYRVSEAVAQLVRREERSTSTLRIGQASRPREAFETGTAAPREGGEALGSSYRRSQRRTSAAAQRRDGRT